MITEDNLQQLFRYAYTISCNEQDAYDLLQSAIEKYLSLTRTVDNKIAYLKRIIKNKHIDNIRHDTKLNFASYDDTVVCLDENINELESLIINEDMAEKILSSLNPDDREIIFYWAYEGYTAQQISDILELPRGTILSKLHRIKARLNKQFDTDTNNALEASQ